MNVLQHVQKWHLQHWSVRLPLNWNMCGVRAEIWPAALGRDSHRTLCTATSHLVVACEWPPRSLLEYVYLTQCAQIPFSPRASICKGRAACNICHPVVVEPTTKALGVYSSLEHLGDSPGYHSGQTMFLVCFHTSSSRSASHPRRVESWDAGKNT